MFKQEDLNTESQKLILEILVKLTEEGYADQGWLVAVTQRYQEIYER